MKMKYNYFFFINLLNSLIPSCLSNKLYLGRKLIQLMQKYEKNSNLRFNEWF